MNCLCHSARLICVRIILLDETDFLHETKDDFLAQALLDVVFSRLNLIETSYFGLRYLDQEGQTHWLDPSTRIARQLKGVKEPFELYFGVKFYAADPCKLLEEITRYQLYLQVKQDILHGRLPVSFDLAAELGAYVVQSELGDYDMRKHAYGYVSEFRLAANQTRELENRITELHQQLRGMVAAQCELNYLDKVKWHDMYGVDLHPVLGEDSVEYFLGLTPSGIIVLRNKTTVAHYFWPRIAKVYFKGRYFMLRVCDKNNEVSTYGFETPKKSACKHLWRCCVEHHAFFRTHRVSPPQANGHVFTIGSRFRGSAKSEKSTKTGRTQHQFVRVPSRRQPRRIFEESHEEKTRLEPARRSMQEVKSISIPQPVQTYDVPYRSSTNIPAAIPNASKASSSKAPDSPRSTRSVPWMRSHQRGLFGINSSPKSVRSATSRASQSQPRQRSSSVESNSSTESRSRKSKRRHRRLSDNESEFSGRSGRSHNSHRKHRRHRSRSRRSGSENEGTNRSSRRRSSSNHSHHSSHSHRASSQGSLELVDSGDQWLEAQRKQSGFNGAVHQAAVVKSSIVTSKKSATLSTSDSYHKRRHRKHKSPSDSRSKLWSSELARHLQFDLVDTEGMTEDQLREIPYTVVETHRTQKKPTSSSLKINKTASKVPNGVDRIRRYPEEPNEKSNGTGKPSPGMVNGSIRSESTISSSKDFDRSSGLIRMMSSLSMGDFISPSGSIMSPLDSNGLRVSHEHTDSGLGADQDYAYSSERSSDSAKYGTNKSSGASVTSMTHSKSSHMSSLKNHHSVSNSKPPMCPNRASNGKIPAVHSNAANNNCLHSNAIFHNNHYTFSLNRHSRGALNGGGGNSAVFSSTSSSTDYLADSAPYTYVSSPQTVSRGTKSDIGVPTSYRRSHKFSSSRTTPNIQECPQVHSSEDSRNNNSPYYISTTTRADYLENYNKTAASMQLYSRPSHHTHRPKQHGSNNNNEKSGSGSGPSGPLIFVSESKKRGDELVSSAAKKDFFASTNHSSSLELILTPIIQSSRRAQ